MISWDAPYDNSEPIDYFDIEIRKADGTWLADLTNCDGSDSTIILAESCTVPMTTLTTTYGLT